jgi:hypothetical protein
MNGKKIRKLYGVKNKEKERREKRLHFFRTSKRKVGRGVIMELEEMRR